MVSRAVYSYLKRTLFLAIAFVACNIGFLQAPQVFAACATTTTPATTYGQVTQTTSVAASSTYKVWSRIKVPDATNNSYYLQIDGGCAYNVGDSASIPANTWTWISYQDGNTASDIVVPLTAGTHTLTYTGREPGVQLDRILLLGDQTCTPTGTGDTPACVNPDVTPPTVNVTAPTAGATISAGTTIPLTASASDVGSGVAKVEFSIDGQAVGTAITTPPYAYNWNTTSVSAGSHVIRALAYDNAGNSQTSASVSVTVSTSTPTTTPAPTGAVTVPFRLNAAGPAFTDSAGQKWQADTYFTGGTTVDRGSIAIAGTTNPTIYRTERYGLTQYNIPVANGTYIYKLHFAETTGSGCTTTGCRSQSIKVEGQPFLTNFDTVAAAGATNTAVVKQGTATVSDGNLTIAFSSTVNETEINGIEILPATTSTPTPTQSSAPTGDANGDGKVNFTDLGIVLTHYGQNYTAADFYHDGVVGANDLSLVLTNWTF